MKIKKLLFSMICVPVLAATLAIASNAADKDKVIYNANGGTIPVSNQEYSVSFGDLITHKYNYGNIIYSHSIDNIMTNLKTDDDFGLSRQGYRFKGWGLNKNDNEILYISDYMNPEVFSEYINDDFVNLYAKWEPVLYTATFLTGNASDNTNNIQTYSVNTSLKDVEDPYKKNYVFAGWKAAGNNNWDGDKVYSSSELMKIVGKTGNVIFNAQWKINLKPIRNKMNNGSKSAENDVLNRLYNVVKKDLKNEKLPEKLTSGSYGKYNITINNSFYDMEKNPFLKSYITACYLWNKDSKKTTDFRSMLADIDYNDYLHSILSLSKKVDISSKKIDKTSYVYNVSALSFTTIRSYYNINDKNADKIYELASEICNVFYGDYDYIKLPVSNSVVTSSYGWHTGKYTYFNHGINISYSDEKIIRSPYFGRIVEAKKESDGTYSVTIDYGKGFEYKFGGFKSLNVKKNSEIMLGEIIGRTKDIYCEIKLNDFYIAPDNQKLLKDLDAIVPFSNVSTDYSGYNIKNVTVAKNGDLWVCCNNRMTTSVDIPDKVTITAKNFPKIKGSIRILNNGHILAYSNGKEFEWYNTKYYRLQTDYFISPFAKYNDACLTSDFGYRDSIGGVTSTTHGGLDICIESGTLGKSVNSIAGGYVEESGFSAYGNYIVINHGNGFKSLYGHLNDRTVYAGQTVKQGDVIGHAGSTYGRGGYSTGPHLHFEVRVNNTKVDPMKYVSALKSLL